MNRKGFTLVELLAVIVVLGIIASIAVVSINGVTQSIKDNILEKKITMIEEEAVLMGQDIRGSIMSSDSRYNNYPCRSFIISDLVPNYLDSDNDNICLTKDSTRTVGCIVNPNNDKEYLDKYEVIVYYRNKRIYAKVDIKNNLTCS